MNTRTKVIKKIADHHERYGNNPSFKKQIEIAALSFGESPATIEHDVREELRGIGYACNNCYISVLIGSFPNSQDVQFVCEYHTGEDCRACDRYGAGYGDGDGGYCDLCEQQFVGYHVYHTYRGLPDSWHDVNIAPDYDEI